jgi:hypothetical protein
MGRNHLKPEGNNGRNMLVGSFALNHPPTKADESSSRLFGKIVGEGKDHQFKPVGNTKLRVN